MSANPHPERASLRDGALSPFARAMIAEAEAEDAQIVADAALGKALREAMATVKRDHDLVITPVADSYTVMIDVPNGPDRYDVNDATGALSDALAALLSSRAPTTETPQPE